MSYRIFISKWVPLYVIAVLLLAAVPFVGQTPAPAAKKATVTKSYTAPRTPDGKPDLQGVWNSATLTPLTRPKEWPAASAGDPDWGAAACDMAILTLQLPARVLIHASHLVVP